MTDEQMGREKKSKTKRKENRFVPYFDRMCQNLQIGIV